MKNQLIILLLFITTPILAETKNGFDLSGSSISADLILQGGPPRDGIPSIDKPVFIAADKSTFMQANDRILGVVVDGIARAYPVKILNWHEIVNDDINGQKIVVTYCPLCGTGMVYSSMVNKSLYTFGVSGLLYNSDVLLYDRETESLWSQILSKAISGLAKGQSLTTIQVSHTSWKTWIEKHPGTQVLTTNTGSARDYESSPYGDYDSNEAVYFPVVATSKRFHPKERVLGITVDGKHKAYPFVELGKTGTKKITDTFANKKLTIEFDMENRDGRVLDETGANVPSINAFWFAWYAFHEESEVYTAEQ